MVLSGAPLLIDVGCQWKCVVYYFQGCTLPPTLQLLHFQQWSSPHYSLLVHTTQLHTTWHDISTCTAHTVIIMLSTCTCQFAIFYIPLLHTCVICTDNYHTHTAKFKENNSLLQKSAESPSKINALSKITT